MKKSNFEKETIEVFIQYRHDGNGNHPHIILGETKDGRIISIGMTSSKEGENYQVIANPLVAQGYIRNRAIISRKNKFYGPVYQGRMYKRDFKYAFKCGKKAYNRSKRNKNATGMK